MTSTHPERSEQLVSAHDLSEVESLSEEILFAIVEYDEQSQEDLSPFGRYIDPDALDDLFAVDGADGPHVDAALSFRYENYRVDVDADGLVRIRREPLE